MAQVAGMEAVRVSSSMGSLLQLTATDEWMSNESVAETDTCPYSTFKGISQPLGGRLIIADHFHHGGEEEIAIHSYHNSCLPTPNVSQEGLPSLHASPLQARYPRM